jgi:hypothetical protein
MSYKINDKLYVTDLDDSVITKKELDHFLECDDIEKDDIIYELVVTKKFKIGVKLEPVK